MFARNSLPTICSEILAATLPFITIGLLGDRIILFISLNIGVISLLLLGLSILFKSKIPFYRFDKIQPQDFSLPYAIALSAAILKNNGINASIGFWCSLGLSIIIISNIFIVQKDSKR